MPLRDAGISAIGRVSEMGSPHERGRALARMEGRGHLPSVYTTVKRSMGRYIPTAKWPLPRRVGCRVGRGRVKVRLRATMLFTGICPTLRATVDDYICLQFDSRI